MPFLYPLADRYVCVICNIKILDNIVKDYPWQSLPVFQHARHVLIAHFTYLPEDVRCCFDTEFFDDICKSSLLLLARTFGNAPFFYNIYFIFISARGGRSLEAVMEILYRSLLLLLLTLSHMRKYDPDSFFQALPLCILQQPFYRHFFRIRLHPEESCPSVCFFRGFRLQLLLQPEGSGFLL